MPEEGLQTIVHGDGTATRIHPDGRVTRDSFTSRDAIVEAEEPWLIERLIEGDNVGEEDAALGKVKLEAIENYGIGKGRVETYADGSMEWVPEGLPTTGEVFFDPNIEPEERFTPQGAVPQRRAHDEMMEKMRSLRESEPTGGRALQMAQMRDFLGIPEGQGVTISDSSSSGEYEEQMRLQRAQMDAFRQARGFQEGGLAAVTGVGEPKMKEDEDQPLVPKPGNIISRALGRIRKAFGFAEGGLVKYAAYAQGGPVRFAEGGGALAAATLGVDPDEEDDPSILGLTEVPGALAAVAGQTPARLPTQSTRRVKMTDSAAMERMNTARQRLVDRLAKTEADKSSQWLAMAQGMLAPTQTGGFGESLGKAAGLVNAVRSEKRKRLTAIENDLLDAEVKQQTLSLAGRPRLGVGKTVYHPDDVAARPNDSKSWRQIAMQMIVHSDGSSENIFSGLEDGRLLEVVSKTNPTTVRDAKEALEIAGAKAKLDAKDISQGLEATLAQRRLRKARDLFETYTTSGLKDDLAAIGQYIGVKIADNETLPRIRNLIGKEILGQLRDLTGTKTDFEYKKIESLNASTKIGTEANLGIIDEMLGRYERVINIGERAAIAHAEDPDTDLQVRRYREYREEEKARQAQATRPQAKRPTAVMNDALVDGFGGPNHDRLIEAFTKEFGWPPVDPEVLSELRKKGYKD